MATEVSCPHCGKGVELKGAKPVPFWNQELGCGTLLLIVLVLSLISNFQSGRGTSDDMKELHLKVDTLTERVAALQGQKPLSATEADADPAAN